MIRKVIVQSLFDWLMQLISFQSHSQLTLILQGFKNLVGFNQYKMKKIFLIFLTLFTISNSFCQAKFQNKEALLVLNGKIISKEILDKIDPKIIDSVKVLKENASIEKYGEKGKFGTIEIYSNQYVSENLNQNQKIIYVLGGIASIYTKEDIEFEKKYNIKYYDFGCIAPTNFEEYEVKNKKVFDSLSRDFGENWQKEIKSSSMGFSEWKIKKVAK